MTPDEQRWLERVEEERAAGKAPMVAESCLRCDGLIAKEGSRLDTVTIGGQTIRVCQCPDQVPQGPGVSAVIHGLPALTRPTKRIEGVRPD